MKSVCSVRFLCLRMTICEKKSYLGNQQQLRKSAIRLLTRDLRQPRRPTRTRQEAASLVDDAQTGRNTARGRDRRQADNRRCRVIRWIVRNPADMARIIRALRRIVPRQMAVSLEEPRAAV